MHRQPASPKKPCRVTLTGEHQWATIKFKPWRPQGGVRTICWICGARKVKE